MEPRRSSVQRQTSETSVSLSLNLDGTGETEIDTGLGFFDHMLTALGKHSRIDLDLNCEGDLEVDDHHTVEDCALVLGRGIDEALGDRVGITRFAHAYAPLDEALVRVVIDFSSRPSAHVNLGFQRPDIGEIATENLVHFFRSFAATAGVTLHVDLIRGENDHHRAEAAFKALALALRQAVARTGSDEVPSTKGLL